MAVHKDARDRYASQEVSYLLQRIGDYNRLVILAANMKNNIDETFIRRFHPVIHFSSRPLTLPGNSHQTILHHF
jgi:SpoVK/Ycf46/Vps4 family AAA+-type ATPase